MRVSPPYIRTLSASCLIIFSVVATHASAEGLQSEMDRLFNEMSNTTRPGIHQTQRRGVIAGGRVTTKARIFDENLVSFVPPSWKAGCGGVDLFGGSLSFVNADQIVQLMRAVAANAKGYAFQLALDNVFPDGAKWIENFQKKVQALNQHLGNSCQLAQGIVNDSLSAFDTKLKNDTRTKASTKGLFEDMFSATQETDGQTAIKTLKDNSPQAYQEMIGNIVWKQLKKNSVSSWFQYGDSSLLEAMMSITGAVVIGDLINDPNLAGANNSTNPIVTLPGNRITLGDLISGGSVKVYSCDSDTVNCISAGSELKSVQLRGIGNQMSDLLLGSDSSPGLIYKYANNVGALSSAEIAFVSNLPSSFGSLFRNLSAVSSDTAEQFAQQAQTIIALDITYRFIEEIYRATTIALANSDNAYQQKAVDVLDASRAVVRQEYDQLIVRHGKLSDLMGYYNSLLDVTKKQRLLLAAQASGKKE
ncbi:conjugal transfer protein TraH [Vibrio cholerae]|nr:conjugal transfer protein TraH [Vibrio cholerae]